MPPKNWAIRISDILDALAAIQTYTAGLTFAGFANDRKTVDAVIRNIIVIGEAASRLPETIVLQYPDIPWREMRDIRRIVAHEHLGVDRKILWETIQSDLPELVEPFKEIIQNLS